MRVAVVTSSPPMAEGGHMVIARELTRARPPRRDPSERASGNVAVYDFNRRIITMSGAVRLNRGGDTLNGGRLTIDLNSGLSSVDGGGARGSQGGRVTGTFTVPDN